MKYLRFLFGINDGKFAHVYLCTMRSKSNKLSSERAWNGMRAKRPAREQIPTFHQICQRKDMQVSDMV